MAKETILIVDDEPDILELLRYNLEKEGYRTVLSATGEEALRETARLLPDLVLLDRMLPGLDGLEVCRRLKRDVKTRSIPVLMITARGEDADIVTGLEVGADDYITKPFSPRVLVARVRAALRRLQPDAASDTREPVRIHGLEIDSLAHSVMAGGNPLDLSPTAFALLELFAREPGRVFSRDQIIDAVKGKDYPVAERAVDMQIVSLRKSLAGFGDLIETVRGVGYRMKR